MTVDMHAHVIPEAFLKKVRSGDPSLGARLETGRNGQSYVVHDQGYRYPLLPGFHNLDVLMSDLDSSRVDMAVVSVAPPLFYYTLDRARGIELAKLLNDAVSEMVGMADGRLAGMATLPMQDPQSAAAELRRAVAELGLRGAHIGTNIEGCQLDDRGFDPVFEQAQELGVPLFLHPYYVGNKSGLERYYLTNLLGNPFETTRALAHLLFGGVFDRFPRLKVCLAHGGGFAPYQIGRLTHGHSVRPEPKAAGVQQLPDWSSQVYYDTLLFDDEALRFLIGSVGADRVMLGSDYPFDMGESTGSERVKRLELGSTDERMVLGETAMQLFGL